MNIGRTEAKAPLLRTPDTKNWLIAKNPDAGKDWRQEEKGMTEDEMAGWHHWFDGHEFEQAPGVGDGQRGLACCSPWGRKELDMIEWLNWTELDFKLIPSQTWTWGDSSFKRLPTFTTILCQIFLCDGDSSENLESPSRIRDTKRTHGYRLQRKYSLWPSCMPEIAQEIPSPSQFTTTILTSHTEELNL